MSHITKELFIITGPIGSGKTTILGTAIQAFRLQDYVYISRDYYFQKYYIDRYEDIKQGYDESKLFFNHILKEACESGKDIILEIVGKDNKIDLIKKFIERSYSVTILYIDVKNLETCIDRVNKRENTSGYNISLQLVKDRYHTSKYYFRKLITIANSAYYVDNSADCDSNEYVLNIKSGVEKMYKLISVDCDGTLLNSEKKITDVTIESIKNAKSKGMKIVIASARPFYRLTKYLKLLDLIDDTQYTIAFNGSLIINNGTQEEIASEHLSSMEIKHLIEKSKEYNPKVFLYTKTGILSNEDDEEYRRRNPDAIFEVKDLSSLDFNEIKIYKFAFVNTPEKIKQIKMKLQSNLEGMYEVSSSVPQFVEVVKKGVTKSKALALIGKELNISSDEMIAFGDEGNDIPMMEYVGLSIAMGNAAEEVKKIADKVTDTNDENGVATALNTLLSNPNITFDKIVDVEMDAVTKVTKSEAEEILSKLNKQ